MPRVWNGCGVRRVKKLHSIKSIGLMRRVMGWTLLTLGVVVAGVWVWSGWQVPSRLTRGPGMWTVRSGLLRYVAPPDSAFSDAYVDWLAEQRLIDSQFEREWGASAWRLDRKVGCKLQVWRWSWDGHGVVVPMWPVAVMMIGGGALMVRSGGRARRRAMTGVCFGCGYDLSGLGAGAVCPECGKGAGAN